MAPLKVLHPVGEREPCFLVVDPKHALPSYRCDLAASDGLRLGNVDESTLVWLATVVVDDAGVVAVNLRAPIVIDPVSMTGRQVMPNACVYPLRYVIDAPA
jgi:flagellar assembly factor FliW